MNKMNITTINGMEKIIDFLRCHCYNASLPYYACMDIKPEGVINEIVLGKVKYYADAKLADYFEWIRNCRNELINCTIVDFTWDGGLRHQVIFLPCTTDHKGRMVACFQDRGTWYHILYKEDTQEFLVFCNFIVDKLDKQRTERLLNVLSIAKPTFL